MTGEIVTRNQNNQIKEWTVDQVEILQSTIAKGLNAIEIKLFSEICQERGLNPFSRQIYAIKREGKHGSTITFQTSIDGFRLIAERTGLYAGQDGPYFYDIDKGWVDICLSKTPPIAAKIGVYKRGFEKPLYVIAKFDEYINHQNPLWRKMPSVMLAKCAESLALRKAFPEALSGLYTNEEMDQASYFDNKPSEQSQQSKQRPLTKQEFKQTRKEIREITNSEAIVVTPQQKPKVTILDQIKIELRRLTDEYKDKETLVEIYEQVGVKDFTSLTKMTNEEQQQIFSYLKGRK